MKYIVGLIAMIILFSGGYFFSEYLQHRNDEKTKVSNDVVLNQIKEVAKLVTVEGYFTEMYSYKNYYNLDWSIFTKKALVRVKAKVSMGIDMNKLQLRFDNEKKILYIGPLPAPELISLDHDIDYYDITEGTFNSFSTEDFNKINNEAKEYIRNVALKSELPQRALTQSQKSVETIKIIAQSAGWKIEWSAPQKLKG